MAVAKPCVNDTLFSPVHLLVVTELVLACHSCDASQESGSRAAPQATDAQSTCCITFARERMFKQPLLKQGLFYARVRTHAIDLQRFNEFLSAVLSTLGNVMPYNPAM